MLKRVIGLTIAALLGYPLFATQAAATISFPTPQTLSEGVGPTYPTPDYRGHDLAVDSSSRTTVVWARYDGTNYRVQSTRVGPDGSPGPTMTLSAAGGDATYPRVAIDGSGRATVVWARGDGANDRIQSVRIAADGTPGPVNTLSAAGSDAWGQQVASDSSGRAMVVWTRSDGSNDRVQSARIEADGTVGMTSNLSAPGQDASLVRPNRFHLQADQMAIDGSGRATVVWTRFADSDDRIQAVRVGPLGNPGPIKTLSDAGKEADFAQVAVDGSGRATVVWTRSDGPNSSQCISSCEGAVQSVRLGATSSDPGAVKTLSEAGHEPGVGHVVVDSAGRAAIAWKEYFGSGSGQIVRIAADGIPGTPQAWGGDGDKQIAIAVDGQDRPTIVHGDEAGGVSVVRFVSQGPPVPISEDSLDVGDGEGGGSPRIAIDDSDRPAVVFKGDPFNPSWDLIQFARANIAYPETTITSGPEGLTSDSSPSFGFSADTPDSSFECSLDSEPFAACASPKSYLDLPDGPHSFSVRAIDVESDVDPTPAKRSFTVATVDGSATAERTQTQKGRQIVVRVRIDAGEDLRAKGKGKVRVAESSYRLKPKAKHVPQGRAKDLKLKPSRNQDAKAIASALEQGIGATAKLKVKLTNRLGVSSSERLWVELGG